MDYIDCPTCGQTFHEKKFRTCERCGQYICQWCRNNIHECIDVYSDNEQEEKIMIEFESNDITIRVTRQQYIEAKTKDLQEFGYPNLNQEHVETQLEYVLTGRKPLDIIGSFIESDGIKEVDENERGDLE